jgi:Kinesin motor domain
MLLISRNNGYYFQYVMQVQIGTHSFTFDHVYGSAGAPSSAIFDECVAPLVDGLFQGYNATVLAYGQVNYLVLYEVIRLDLAVKLIPNDSKG